MSTKSMQALVYDRKLAQSVSCWFDSMKLGSVFACDLVAKPGVALPELEKVFDAALARPRTRGPDAADLGRARTAHRSGFLHGLERLLSRANLLNEYRHFTGDPGYLAKDLARYDAVTVGTMKQAADQWLDPARRVVVTVTPEKEAAR